MIILQENIFCVFEMPFMPIVVPGHSCECGVSRKVMCFHLEGIIVWLALV